MDGRAQHHAPCRAGAWWCVGALTIGSDWSLWWEWELIQCKRRTRWWRTCERANAASCAVLCGCRVCLCTPSPHFFQWGHPSSQQHTHRYPHYHRYTCTHTRTHTHACSHTLTHTHTHTQAASTLLCPPPVAKELAAYSATNPSLRYFDQVYGQLHPQLSGLLGIAMREVRGGGGFRWALFIMQ